VHSDAADVQRRRSPVAEEDLNLIPSELLACKPRQDRNIYTVNRDAAIAMTGARSGKPPADAARMLCGVGTDIPTPEVRTNAPALVWYHYLQEIMLDPEQGIELPATYLYPAKEHWRGAAVLYFDDRGRWTDLRVDGPLAQIAGFIQKDTDGPAVLSVDLRGWGDTRPADTRYDLAGWAHRERWIEYVTASMGDSILAMRVRDGLAALAYLRSRPEIDPAKIVVGGHGMGGAVALHVAALDPAVEGVLSLDGLATFESLAVSEGYTWPPDAFFPGVLRYYDLPELAASLGRPVLIAAPRDAMQAPLDGAAASALYLGDKVRVETDNSPALLREYIRAVVSSDG